LRKPAGEASGQLECDWRIANKTACAKGAIGIARFAAETADTTFKGAKRCGVEMRKRCLFYRQAFCCFLFHVMCWLWITKYGQPLGHLLFFIYASMVVTGHIKQRVPNEQAALREGKPVVGTMPPFSSCRSPDERCVMVFLFSESDFDVFFFIKTVLICGK
jgi:hypothetical protein